MNRDGLVLALCGGVGGAKVALGLSCLLAGERLIIACNTGDDFQHLGLAISPDVDTILYTLSGLSNRELGWGREGETWNAMAALEALGGETWFRLGDADLALHLVRTQMLQAGATPSEVVDHVRLRLGIEARVVPATDDPVRTIVATNEGELAFQDYFVRSRCEPPVRSLRYEGAERAKPAPAVSAAFDDQRLSAIVFCPSNPYLSLAPILAIPAVSDALRRRRVPSVAVSPLVGGKAVKGPTDKIMAEMGLEPSALEIARYLRPWIDMLILDESDAGNAGAIESIGVKVVLAPTLMTSTTDKIEVARTALRAANVPC
ncbi:MAG TPA: 2-phospho-L-lactate transferase [Sphingomicrobium sp.]|nr:2-phospho-L-lactate transferase [Sphingomicrobium sp.]